MGTEGLLSPQMLWMLLWIQLCRGKCHLPCPTAQGQQVPAWSLGSIREWGFFAGATETRGRRCSSPSTLCPPGWERVSSPSPGFHHLGQPVPGWIHRHPVMGDPLGTPCSLALRWSSG